MSTNPQGLGIYTQLLSSSLASVILDITDHFILPLSAPPSLSGSSECRQ